MKHWRCCLGLRAWLLMTATAVFSAALTLLLVEAVLERLVAAGGLWGVVPFVVAAIVVCIGILVMLTTGFGWGAIRGSWFGIPPAWVVGVFTILAFWLWLWWLGPEPHSYPNWALAHGLKRLHTVFSHGWVWLWGAVISCGLALAIWQAALPRLLAHCSRRLRRAGWLGRELAPLPVDDASARADAIRRQQQEALAANLQGIREGLRATAGANTPDLSARDCAGRQAAGGAASESKTSAVVRDGPSDREIDRWLQGNEEPLQQGDHDLFGVNPSPQRVLAGLRPTHQYGGARTLALVGQRGGGKSSLLRLAAGLPEAKNGVELRFVYVSLWEYKTAQAAIQDMIGKVLNTVRDHIDIFPFTGAGGAFVRAMTGDGRFHWLNDALGLYNPIDDIIEALSAMLLWNKLRVIVCIEDGDRLANAAQKKQFVNLITGTIDYLRRFPGFGYVLCISSNDWSELQRTALNKVEPPGKQRERREIIEQAVRASKEEEEDKSQIFKDIEILRRAATIAAKKQLSGFDTSRLCREELVIPPLAHEQWLPILESVRRQMFQLVGQNPAEDCFDLIARRANGQQNTGQVYAGGRQLVWNKLIDKLMSAPFTIGRPIPEFGLANAEGTGFSFTPRSLRRGLGDAWRKWLAIRPMLSDKVVVDPDSVLVACLVRACRPDVWNILIRDENLLLGGDWPTTNYLVQHVLDRQYAGAGQMVMANRFDKDQWGYGQAWPHLGLSQEIINIMRKSCQVSDLSTDQVVLGTNVSESVEEPFLPTAVRATPSLDIPRIDVVRPGGLIGSLAGESSSASGSNWRLFLNA